MLLYYITDRAQFAGGENQRRVQLLDRMAEAARCGIDLVQLREKDLPARDLESLAQSAVEIVRASGSSTRLLINSRTDVALAVGAQVYIFARMTFPLRMSEKFSCKLEHRMSLPWPSLVTLSKTSPPLEMPVRNSSSLGRCSRNQVSQNPQ